MPAKDADDERHVDRYEVNDNLTARAASFGVRLDDDTLNELTHHVADVFDAALNDGTAERENEA